MIALAIVLLVLAYLITATHTLRRLAWHFCHDKSRYNRDGGLIGALVLALALPVGLALLAHLDRTMKREGTASFMLAPRKVRQEKYIRELEQKLEISS